MKIGKIIKKKVLKSRLGLKLNKIFSIVVNYYSFNHTLKTKIKTNIFEYRVIAEPLPRLYTDFVPENNDKCMSRCLKKYMGVGVFHSLNTMIEHGLFFGNFVAPREFDINVPSIITFGNSRIIHLKAKHINKNIIPIGPYIHYADPLLSKKDFSLLKKQLGRVLLVFPSHSLASENMVSLYDLDGFANEIKRIGKDYDTILISLHYSDIDLGKKYEEYGFKCVCSGHTNDPYFMNRQRSIIELADVTMSNAVGTHIGYCIYLNKPHYIFKQKIDQRIDKELTKETSSWLDKEIYNSEINEVIEAFNVYSPIITEEQREVVNKYWGTEYIRTPEELKELVKSTII